MNRRLKHFWLILLIFFFALAERSGVQAFESGKSAFQVQCGDRILEYSVQMVSALPAEVLVFQVRDLTQAKYCFKSQAGKLHSQAGKWLWQAPRKPGSYSAEIFNTASQTSMRVRLLVLVPYSRACRTINGYRIGRYPSAPHNPLYLPPKGFIEVTAENQATWLSPHFQLKQFLCKQKGTFPKYLVLDERLVRKLEVLLEKVNKKYPCQTLALLSGYRTPDYNRRIGDVAFSSHLWGLAADVYVDEDQDGRMDDLNRDGRIDEHDAEMLYCLVETMDQNQLTNIPIGGLGLYSTTSDHGPFVHLDTRGFRARWGIRVEEIAVLSSLRKNRDSNNPN